MLEHRDSELPGICTAADARIASIDVIGKLPRPDQQSGFPQPAARRLLQPLRLPDRPSTARADRPRRTP
ncbi:MAG: hypothetical protein M0Q87_07100 [Ottowia sp.]|nr:hypothetical protein [Ottowia sp.]